MCSHIQMPAIEVVSGRRFQGPMASRLQTCGLLALFFVLSGLFATPVFGAAATHLTVTQLTDTQAGVQKSFKVSPLDVSDQPDLTFTGTVRSETRGRRVRQLAYEAYPGMAEKAMADIGRDIEQLWPGSRAAIIHRVGTLLTGEAAVVIAVSAPHRAAAFEGCRHAIERLKADVPIWKKERFEDGEEWVGLGP